MNLKDKVVLITGASKGIGRAAAIAFAKESCRVIINFKSDEKSAQSVLEECNKHSKGNLILKADVSIEREVKELFDLIKSKFSKIDILINNVGIFDESDNPSNVSAFDNIYKNNFLSHILVTKYAKDLMDVGKIIYIFLKNSL